MSIELEVGDQVILKSQYKVEITREQDHNKYSGSQVENSYVGSEINTGEDIYFYESDIECIKKYNLKPCGGDYTNYWLFYTGSGYNTTAETIANYAVFELRDTEFFDMSIEEIMNKHIYCGTDSSNYKAMYNGDTYVLFIDIDKLPEDMRIDAEKQF